MSVVILYYCGWLPQMIHPKRACLAGGFSSAGRELFTADRYPRDPASLQKKIRGITKWVASLQYTPEAVTPRSKELFTNRWPPPRDDLALLPWHGSTLLGAGSVAPPRCVLWGTLVRGASNRIQRKQPFPGVRGSAPHSKRWRVVENADIH